MQRSDEADPVKLVETMEPTHGVWADLMLEAAPTYAALGKQLWPQSRDMRITREDPNVPECSSLDGRTDICRPGKAAMAAV